MKKTTVKSHYRSVKGKGNTGVKKHFRSTRKLSSLTSKGRSKDTLADLAGEDCECGKKDCKVCNAKKLKKEKVRNHAKIAATKTPKLKWSKVGKEGNEKYDFKSETPNGKKVVIRRFGPTQHHVFVDGKFHKKFLVGGKKNTAGGKTSINLAKSYANSL